MRNETDWMNLYEPTGTEHILSLKKNLHFNFFFQLELYTYQKQTNEQVARINSWCDQLCWFVLWCESVCAHHSNPVAHIFAVRNETLFWIQFACDRVV